MRNKIHKLYIAVPFLVTLIVVTALIFSGCGKKEYTDKNADIMRRIPDTTILIVSAKPKEILNSPLFASLSSLNKAGNGNFRKKEQEFMNLTGVDLAKDIDRIVIMSEDIRNFSKTWSVLVQGDLNVSFIDSLITHTEIGDSVFALRGFDVHYITAANKADFLKLYVCFDENEALISSGKTLMDKMLGLKQGKGKALADNKLIMQKYDSIKYREHIWFMLPVEGLMNDVLDKVQAARPDFKLDIKNISAIQGGLNLGDELGVSLQAYCTDKELVALFADTINGFIAMGKLTVGSIPQVREILDTIEVSKNENLLECNVSLPLENLLALQALKNMP